MAVFTFQEMLLNVIYSIYESKDKHEKYTIEFYLSLAFHHLFYNPFLQNEIIINSHINSLSIRYRNYKNSGINLENFSIDRKSVV